MELSTCFFSSSFLVFFYSTLYFYLLTIWLEYYLIRTTKLRKVAKIVTKVTKMISKIAKKKRKKMTTTAGSYSSDFLKLSNSFCSPRMMVRTRFLSRFLALDASPPWRRSRPLTGICSRWCERSSILAWTVWWGVRMFTLSNCVLHHVLSGDRNIITFLTSTPTKCLIFQNL